MLLLEIPDKTVFLSNQVQLLILQLSDHVLLLSCEPIDCQLFLAKHRSQDFVFLRDQVRLHRRLLVLHPSNDVLFLILQLSYSVFFVLDQASDQVILLKLHVSLGSLVLSV